MGKLVSINIPFYNSLRNELQDCIATVRMFTHHPYELILIDDGSEDEESSAFAQEHADLYIRHDETEGIAKSRHDGILASSGDYICTLDSDTIVTPYWLTGLVEKHGTYQDDSFRVYILGAMVSCWLGFYIDKNQLYHRDKGLIECSETGNACMLFERSLIDLIGNFEPELYNLLSDLDFCRRARSIQIPGVTPKVCITPEVTVYHHGWVDPVSGYWKITLDQLSTRTQAKFHTREWQIKNLRGLEILNERWAIKEAEMCALREELSKRQDEEFQYDEWTIGQKLYGKILELLSPGKTILELGSGRGTELLNRTYSMYSVESELEYVGLYNSTYIHAPRVGAGWYDPELLAKLLPDKYDCLLIDGPRGSVYRALMAEHLDLFDLERPIIFCDDIHREAERGLFDRIAQQTKREAVIINENATKQFGIIQ